MRGRRVPLKTPSPSEENGERKKKRGEKKEEGSTVMQKLIALKLEHLTRNDEG